MKITSFSSRPLKLKYLIEGSYSAQSASFTTQVESGKVVVVHATIAFWYFEESFWESRGLIPLKWRYATHGPVDVLPTDPFTIRYLRETGQTEISNVLNDDGVEKWWPW